MEIVFIEILFTLFYRYGLVVRVVVVVGDYYRFVFGFFIENVFVVFISVGCFLKEIRYLDIFSVG